MTATLDTGDGRDTLRFERALTHPRERVWSAVTDPAELSAWFPSAVVYEPRVGAPMQFDFGGEHGLDVWPGEVLEWEPPRVFAFAWGEDVLRFELAEDGDGTTLVFTHAFAHQPGKPARDGAGWASCLDALDGLLDGVDREGHDWSAHHDAHLARFGELVVEGDGGSLSVGLAGPYAELDGRPAVNIGFRGRTGVLVVRDPGAELADGAGVDVRAGTVDAPGETLASGVLRDPLAP
jgi:uncharacterized protein YndB with AHSA1/START domain